MAYTALLLFQGSCISGYLTSNRRPSFTAAIVTFNQLEMEFAAAGAFFSR